MVALSDVEASNKRIASAFPDGLVAVFVGGTSGVGEYTLKALAASCSKTRAYIVGRSQQAADRIISECKQVCPDGTFEFFQTDVSLVKNVDEACRQIRSKVSAINILFLSQGSMDFTRGMPH